MYTRHITFEELRHFTAEGYYEINRARKKYAQNPDFSLVDTESETYIYSEDGSPQSVSAALYFNEKTGEYLELTAYVDLQYLNLVESCWIYQPVDVK